MTELREDVIAAVRFGCTFADVWEALRDGLNGGWLTLPRENWWTPRDLRLENSPNAIKAAARDWIIAPADATAAEIAEARRRWEKGERIKAKWPGAIISAPEPAANAEGGCPFQASAILAFDQALRAAQKAQDWGESDVEQDAARAPDQARLAAEWLRIARDLDAARDLVKRWGGE
jgi:hypothetical protein